VKKLFLSVATFSIFAAFLFSTPASAFNEWTRTGGPYAGWVGSVAVSPDYANDQTVFAGTGGGGVFKSTDGGASWIPVLTGQEFNAIAISPNYAVDQTVYAGARSGGVFKTTDRGSNWSPVNNGLLNLGVSALDISPNYAVDQTVFAGTWGGGVYKTTDRGSNWGPASSGITNGNITALAASPNYAVDQIVFAGTEGGLFKTVNGGSAWNPANTGITNNSVSAVAVSPNFANDQTAYAGTDGGGVFKTMNQGSDWSPVNAGITNLAVRALVVSPAYGTDQTVYAGTLNSYQQGGVFKTTNSGTDWSVVKDCNAGRLAISPNYASDQTVYSAVWTSPGGGIFKTTDKGAAWVPVNAGLNSAFINDLAVSPNYAVDLTVFTGTEGGVYRTTNAGTTWEAVNTDLNSFNIEVRAIAVSPNYAVDRTVFIATTGGFYKTVNSGANWSYASVQSWAGDVYALGISPNYASDQTVYVGTGYYGIYKSTNGGTNWSQVNIGLSGTNVLTLAISPNYAADQTVFAGIANAGIFMTSNAGQSWSFVDTGLSGLIYTVLIRLSPGYASDQTVFAYLGSTASQGLYKTADKGAHWNLVLDTYTSSLAISPNYAVDQTLYVDNYKSSDGGTSWSNIGGPPGGGSLALSPNYVTDRTVYSGSMDSGVWKYVIDHPSPVVTTAAVIGITATTASAGGNVTSDGVATVTAKGVCWSTSDNPTINDSCTNDGAGTGSFISNIDGLTHNITYHVRAYATNSAGTGYGEDVAFTTLDTCTLTVTKEGNGNGNVTIDGAPITFSGNIWTSQPYPYGSSIQLIASADTLSNFSGWSGACNGNNPCPVTLNADKTVRPTFDSKANFTATPMSGYAPLLVSFLDESTNSPVAWSWSFGDGGNSAMQHPTHTFKTPNSYNVLFRATGPDGLIPEVSKTIVVNPCAHGPVFRAGLDYAGIQKGYDAANNNDLLQLLAVDFTENLHFGRNIAVTLDGGYNCSYATKFPSSTVNGTMTVSSGTVTVEDLVVGPGPTGCPLTGTWYSQDKPYISLSLDQSVNAVTGTWKNNTTGCTYSGTGTISANALNISFSTSMNPMQCCSSFTYSGTVGSDCNSMAIGWTNNCSFSGSRNY